MRREERYERVLNYFRHEMPQVQTELAFGSVFQLLVAVVLSAQCTDRRVNMVTVDLFARYPSARELAEANEEEVRGRIASISYPNAKAHHLVEMSKALMLRFDGEVPSTIEELVSLPGVGRKTANVILSVAFGQATMAVDTHVYRVSHRLGLVSVKDNTPLKVELTLKKYIPTVDVPKAHHWLLLHGRYVCTSRSPHCDRCGLKDFCPKLLGGSKL